MKQTASILTISAALALGGCATQQQTDNIPASSGSPAVQATKKQASHKSRPAKGRLARASAAAGGKASGAPAPAGDSIWTLLDEHIAFAPAVSDNRIGPQLKRFSHNQEYFDRTLERASLYLPYVLERVVDAGLPAEIALLPFIESAYNPFAYSPSGAAGLWQFIPSTGDSMALTRNHWYDGRRDVIRSTDAAIEYLQSLNAMFDGDWLLTLAAYNAGPGTVQRAIDNNRRKGKATDYWSLPLRSETRRYVPRLVALTKVISAPDHYGVKLQDIPRDADLAVVDLPGPVDLNQAARLAGLATDEIYHLNPGYTRWVTPPSGPHQLVLPADSAEGITEKLTSLEDKRWQPLEEYSVARGDNLGRIARRYRISVAELAALNNIESRDVLKVGQRLLVPTAANTVASAVAPVLNTYRVKPGDSLWTIAKANDIPLGNLLVWNNISRDTLLQPGQELRFYPGGSNPANASYKVRSGDSLYSIAKQHSVKLKDLLAWNNLSVSSMIRPGQLLKIGTR